VTGGPVFGDFARRAARQLEPAGRSYRHIAGDATAGQVSRAALDVLAVLDGYL
jgi:hypothetical protein